MRKLAHDRAQLWDGVAKVFYSSGWSGGVRAQRRMAQRMADIPGVAGAHLSEGKRGRFTIILYDQTDWNPSTNSEIRVGDPIPEKP